MQKGEDKSKTSITNEGDNQNEMENVEAGRDIEQKNEIHQYHQEGSDGTVVPDPNSQNFWIDVCEAVSNLPISETKIIGTLLSLGTMGLLGFFGLTTPWDGISTNPSNFRLLFGLAFTSAIFIGFAIGYINTDSESRCPECDERFAVRPVEIRKTDTTERENSPDIIHGEVDRECRSCGFEETQPDTWTADEFSNL